MVHGLANFEWQMYFYFFTSHHSVRMKNFTFILTCNISCCGHRDIPVGTETKLWSSMGRRTVVWFL